MKITKFLFTRINLYRSL